VSVYIEKITRRTGDEAVLADELSKGKFGNFLRRLPADFRLPESPAWIPPAILAWIADPTDDPNLGEKILSNLREKTTFL
jgi:hypothetical protein